MVTDEMLEDLRTTLYKCIAEKRQETQDNFEYNEGWIDALRYAINHLENFEG